MPRLASPRSTTTPPQGENVIKRLHRHRICGGLLAGTVVMAIGLLGSASAANASLCVVGPGVVQTETTVTGSPGNDTIACGGTSPGKTITGNSGNDTITGTDQADTISGGNGDDTITGGTGDDTLDGGLGIDTISGSAGNDSLVGPSFDGSQDKLDGGLNTDTCQGPPPDPDSHASCENTSLPSAGSSGSLAKPLCQASGGIYTDVSPLLYTCLFPLFVDHRATEARRICNQRSGTFADLPLIYSCVLPTGAQATRFGALV